MEFHKDLAIHISRNNTGEANRVIMEEVGKAVVHHRADFIDLLNNSDVPAYADMADAHLVELYINNINKKDLLIGSAFMVNMQNKTMGADGTQEVSNTGVQQSYATLNRYFVAGSPSGTETEEHRLDWMTDPIMNDEKKSEFWGAAIAGATGIAGKVLEGQHTKKYGALDAVKAQQKAKADIARSVMQQRQTQLDTAKAKQASKAKNLKIGLIVGGSVVGLSIIGLVIYLIKRK